MSVIYVALTIAIALGATALFACVRSIRAGQFDDLDSPPLRILIDDDQQYRKLEKRFKCIFDRHRTDL